MLSTDSTSSMGIGLDLLEVEQAAQRAPVPVLLVDQRGILLEHLVAAGAHRLLKLVDGLRIEQVILAVLAPLVLAAGIEHVAVDLPVRERPLVPEQDFLGDDVDADAVDARGRPGEILVDDVLLQADGLEDLRAPIALDGRDAHLRHHLHDALHGGLEVILAGGLVVDARQQPLAEHVVERLEGEVGIDRAAAVADQQREMMHFARLAGFEHQADAGARAFADQVVMQAGDRQQRRDRRAFLVHAAVGEDEHVDAVLDGLADLGGKGRPSPFPGRRAPSAAWNRIGKVTDLKPGRSMCLSLANSSLVRMGDLSSISRRVLRRGLEQVALRADGRLGRGDDLLADAVNRRVGDLGEELLEVVVERLRLVGQHRQRRVGAHRADGFDAVARHRQP